VPQTEKPKRGSPLETPKNRDVPSGEAILVIFVTFFLIIFVGGILYLTLGNEPTLILGELIILIAPLSYLLYKRVNIREFVRIDLNPKFILIGVAFGAALIPLNIFLSTALTAILGNSSAVEDANLLYANLSATPLGLTVVATSMVLAGICEEFAFRGFLQNSIFRNLQKNPRFSKYALIIALLIASVTFGIFHLDPQFVYIIATFVPGLVLGYIYYRWGYTASATAHASMNLIVLAFLLLGI
jgi:membrane protease YdiL (CAAX protease family)